MAQSNYGKSPEEVQTRIDAYRERIRSRHENARRIGDDDAIHLGLSAWAEDLNLRLLEQELELAHRGWIADFPALADLDGNPVPARIVNTKYGRRWMLLDDSGNATGEFAPFSPKRESTLSKRGLKQISVERPAMAVIDGRGRGLSGQAWVAVIERHAGAVAA